MILVWILNLSFGNCNLLLLTTKDTKDFIRCCDLYLYEYKFTKA